MNVPRTAPHVKQPSSDSSSAIPRRQSNLSLPCIPSDVDNWLSAELEKRGLNPIIYGPTVINLLTQQRQSSIPVAEQYNARVRVIELLLKASNGGQSTDDISRLVDEADNRLRQCTNFGQEFPSTGPASVGASPNFGGSSHNIPAAVAAVMAAVGATGKGLDEGFTEWGSSPRAPAAPAPADRGEEEGELLLSEVSDMLQQFNMEVRHGVDIDASLNSVEASPPVEQAAAASTSVEPTPAAVVGIPNVNGRKRDASIDSGVGSFNWSNSRDCSNESSPPSVLDWLSVSPGGSSIWSATSPAPSSAFSTGMSVPNGPLSADTPSAWSYPHNGQFRRMRFTSAPTYAEEDFPEISRHRGLSTSSGLGTPAGRKKKNTSTKTGAGKQHLHLIHRQASPPSDSGSSTSSGGSSPPASGVGLAPGSPASGIGGKSSLEKSRRACSFYLRGHCKKEDCEFAHDLTKVTCKFWMTGECFKGDTCPFLHGQLRGSQ